MGKIPRRLLILGMVFVSVMLLLIFSKPTQTSTPSLRPDFSVSHATTTDTEWIALVEAIHSDPTLGGVAQLSSSDSVQQDLCLHCHLSGEDTNVWTPVSRWMLFGVAGLVFAFGIYRGASVWRTRQPWKPLTLRAVDWVDERYQIKEPLAEAMSKPVPKFARQWFYCLGGITFLLFVVQALTGIMLAFYYAPTAEGAYASVQYIEEGVNFGAAIRAMHHWSANGMIVMCFAHMFRVFISGAYRAPRELNWVGGVLLLIMTLAFGFTGYLLPWDQQAFWATTVGTDIVGGVPDAGPLALVFLRSGWTVSAETLSRFYAIHVIVLPIATLALLGLHFLMIRRQGVARPL